MSKKLKIALLAINVALCVATVLLTCFLMDSWGVLVRAFFYCAAGVGLTVSVVTFILKKEALFKSAFILLII